MQDLQIKTDPELPHHYLIGVCMKPLNNENAGDLFMKYYFYFHNDDVDNLQSAILLSKDRLFKTTINQSLENFKVKTLVSILGKIKMSCNANHATLHHFSSKDKLDEDSLDQIVKYSNKEITIKNEIMKAMVKW